MGVCVCVCVCTYVCTHICIDIRFCKFADDTMYLREGDRYPNIYIYI